MKSIKIVESSLNLRIEKGKKPKDYSLKKRIADKQLSLFGTDIFTNVEYMDCKNDEYLSAFEKAGYKSYIALDPKERGILCEIKNEYTVEKIAKMNEPHLLHLRVKSENDFINLITVRLLVSDGGAADYKDRKIQWDNVIHYLKSLNDKSHIVLTGDFNHGVINEDGDYHSKPREYYNYQMVVKDLKKENIELFPMEGNSYRNYMKIDHIATGNDITVDNAVYKDMFNGAEGIGIPDHSCIIANIICT